MPNPLNDEHLEIEVAERYAAGESLADIATALGVKPYRSKLLFQRFVSRHNEPHLDLVPEEVVFRGMRDDGTTYAGFDLSQLPLAQRREIVGTMVQRIRDGWEPPDAWLNWREGRLDYSDDEGTDRREPGEGWW